MSDGRCNRDDFFAVADGLGQREVSVLFWNTVIKRDDVSMEELEHVLASGQLSEKFAVMLDDVLKEMS